MRNTNDMRACPGCGRPLEPGESCNCQQIPRGATRDGLHATCPMFGSRSSFHGQSYISCGGRRLRFAGSDGRNAHYAAHCCGAWRTCPHLDTTKTIK